MGKDRVYEQPTRAELIGQIRFALALLSSRNAHHAFEEACRHLAHARIATNLLPATGPVAAGGDQGRDFETFHSYLRRELGDSGWFAGRVSNDTLAAICTLQQGSIAGKLKNDVGKIVGSGTRVERVYAFCGSDMPAGARHKLIDDVRREYDVELELLDASAIAEQMADHDTFWIAHQYLELPAHLAPAPPDDEVDSPGWYRATLERWRASPPRPVLPELLDVRAGLRHSASDRQARADVGFWLELMRGLTDEAHPPPIRQLARYEVVVASLRAIGDLRACDALLAAHLDEAVEDASWAELQDAATLLSDAAAASIFGHSDLETKRITAWKAALASRVETLLLESPPPGARARLLLIKGYLALVIDADRFEPDHGKEVPLPKPLADFPRVDASADDLAHVYSAEAVAEAFSSWAELARCLERTPLFPVDEFAHIWRFLTPLLAEQPGWIEVTSAIDEALARSHGGWAAGRACRGRAEALIDAGKLRLALHELHRAKAEWWSGDNLRGALETMEAVALVYENMGLLFAAKQHMFAVAGAAFASHDPELRELTAAGMLGAARLSYQSGEWITALEEIEIGLAALHTYNDEQDPVAQRLLEHAIVTYGFCYRGARDLLPSVRVDVEEIGLRFGILDGIRNVLDDFDRLSHEDWVEQADRDLHGRPFSDTGASYEIRFAALGTRWRIHCVNRYGEVRAAQRLAAAAQILLVELAEDDLCLIPSELDVEVRVTDRRVEPRARPNNEKREWIVHLTEFEPGGVMDPETTFLELLTVLSVLMLDISLVGQQRYFETIERAFQRGLGHKVAAGRPYDEMAEIVPLDRWTASGRTSLEPPVGRRTEPASEHKEVAWQDGPGPTYSDELAEEMARNRYETITDKTHITIARLQRHEPFMQVVRDLRADGWRDWHLLTALYNVSCNARMAARGLNTSDVVLSPSGARAIQALSLEREREDARGIPLDMFSRDALVFAMEGAMSAVLANWDLHPRQRTPDMRAIERVLAARYAYWTSDAPHDDPFPDASATT